MLKPGINLDISNYEYHNDRKFLSSSGLKLLYKDLPKFYEQYILGKKEESKNQTALDIGTLAHTMILEPHLFDDSFVVFDGLRRSGEKYQQFLNQNPNKIIITQTDFDKLMSLKTSYESSTHKHLVENSLYEYTLCSEIDSIPVKCRADSIDPSRGIITDIKTTAYASGHDIFKNTLEMLSYDISAALYCHIAEKIYNRSFDFYFVVLSKNDLQVEYYKTSKDTLAKGRLKIEQAIKNYKRCLLTNDWSPEILESDDILEV